MTAGAGNACLIVGGAATALKGWLVDPSGTVNGPGRLKWWDRFHKR